MMYKLLVVAAAVCLASGQQQGHQKANQQPAITYSTCTKAGGCTQQTGGVQLDANWAWAHSVGGYQNCFTGNSWDKTLCPDPKTCAQKCALDIGGYSETYGISVSGSEAALKFVTTEPNGQAANVGSRTYLTESTDAYKMFKLKNMEFTFTVDDSTLPCGLNGALYFVAMSQDGGASKYPGNSAGAAYGTGYCDAQCPQDIKFIHGEANILGWTPTSGSTGKGMYGTCCTEMDIWESNSISQAVTPHPCSSQAWQEFRCNGTACGEGAQRQNGVCDKDGGDFNPYRLGDKTFYGPGSNFAIDSSQPVTVVTQFITNDNTASGDLVEIRRLYVQNGKVIPARNVTVNGKQYDSVTDNFINDEKSAFGDPNTFAARGGLKSVGESMENGMVLVMSLWADDAAHMLWLDSSYPPSKSPSSPGTTRGSCATTTGNPADLIKNSPDATVKYSDIKFGEIGSTYPSGPSPPSGCPGGSLQACIALCPTSPPAAYKDCVEQCAKDCP